MKVCLLIILLMGTGLGQRSLGDEANLYRLDGSVNRVKTTYEKPNEIHVGFEISYKLTNISDKNLILWNPLSNKIGTIDSDRVVEGIPLPLGHIFSTNRDFSESSTLESHYGGPSTSYADEWKILRQKLDVEQPPKDVTITLKPHESWEFTSTVYVIAFKERRPGRIDFETLEKYSPIWAKTYHEVWSFNIEPEKAVRTTKPAFGKMLQKRWADYGHLLLGDLVSEPISLDFGSAVIKTDSQPRELR